MSAPTIFSSARSLPLVLSFLAACGGKGPGATPPQVPAAGEIPGPPWGFEETGVLPPEESLSPEEAASLPRVRVGLSTRADSIRLTAPLPFFVGAGKQWVRTHELLVEKEEDATREGRVFRVQVGSFLDEAGAQKLLEDAREETGMDAVVAREAVTGRYAVRLGSWSTAAGADAARDELHSRGYEGSRVISEPSTVGRPRSLVVRPAGGPVVHFPLLGVVALPGARGAWIEIDGRPYRGFFEIAVNASNRLTVVNVVHVEDYLKGVVPAELSPAVYPELEAVKAQAVAARTYAARHRGQFGAEGFDICATPACQVYRGVAVEQEMSSEAVELTRSEILVYEGEPIDALYTSTCGGRTEDAENVFSRGQPYLKSRSCYAERAATRLTASVPRGVSLELAGAAVTGLVEPGGGSTGRELERMATAMEARTWVGRALESLGQRGCRAPSWIDGNLSALAFARLLAGAFCWEGRLPFLLDGEDVEGVVPSASTPGIDAEERRYLAYAILQGAVRPPPEGVDAHALVTRRSVLEGLYRVVASRGEPPLLPARFRGIEETSLRVRYEGAETEEVLRVARRRFLFQQVGDLVFFSPSLLLLPDDRIELHEGADGVDLLVRRTEGASYDRSSRYSQWMERRTSEELSRTLADADRLGEIVDLRPKRYGRSGRVAELEVVGTEGSKTLEGLVIRRSLGIRENLFFIDRQVGDDGAPKAWLFTGRGWGHGVGLCQVGAYGMAAAGLDYRQILAHYYPGTRLVSGEGLVSGGRRASPNEER